MGLFGKSNEGTSRQDILEILATCSAKKGSAMLLGHHTGRVIDGLFLAASEGGVAIALRAQAGEGGIEPMSLWCVSFTQGGRAHVFLSSAIAYDAGAPPRVTLQIPAQIAIAEGRFSFRTPVVPGVPVSVQIATSSGGVYRPDLMDLSLGGCQVRFPPALDPMLPVGTRVTFVILMERTTAKVVAEVRRRDSGRYGLYFCDVFQDGELRPPDGLRKIVRALEVRWLREE